MLLQSYFLIENFGIFVYHGKKDKKFFVVKPWWCKSTGVTWSLVNKSKEMDEQLDEI